MINRYKVSLNRLREALYTEIDGGFLSDKEHGFIKSKMIIYLLNKRAAFGGLVQAWSFMDSSLEPHKVMTQNTSNNNRVLQAASTHAVICIDITKWNINGELWLAVDLASKCIVGALSLFNREGIILRENLVTHLTFVWLLNSLLI